MTDPAAVASIVGSIRALSVALDERDSFTQDHCNRVVTLAGELGQACGASAQELNDLRVGAQFHDVGKIGVPDHVLLKPGRLTPEEWVLMRSHAEQGERILKAASIPRVEIVADTVRHHHEAYDGTGYPDGLKGENIPLLSRLLLIVDGYDAMGSSRPYHKAREHKTIMETLESEKGRKLDPYLLGKFAKLIEKSPARVP